VSVIRKEFSSKNVDISVTSLSPFTQKQCRHVKVRIVCLSALYCVSLRVGIKDEGF